MLFWCNASGIPSCSSFGCKPLHPSYSLLDSCSDSYSLSYYGQRVPLGAGDGDSDGQGEL